jgi:hypothetical protein
MPSIDGSVVTVGSCWNRRRATFRASSPPLWPPRCCRPSCDWQTILPFSFRIKSWRRRPRQPPPQLVHAALPRRANAIATDDKCGWLLWRRSYARGRPVTHIVNGAHYPGGRRPPQQRRRQQHQPMVLFGGLRGAHPPRMRSSSFLPPPPEEEAAPRAVGVAAVVHHDDDTGGNQKRVSGTTILNPPPPRLL